MEHRNKLRNWAIGDIDEDSTTGDGKIPKPTLEQVLYRDSNANGSRKMCENCVFYGYERGQCYLHGNQLRISKTSVCGYHGYSSMQRRLLIDAPMNPVIRPEQSNLRETDGDGISCDTCRYYAAPPGSTIGECIAVSSVASVIQESFPTVAGLGVCTRWEKDPEQEE